MPSLEMSDEPYFLGKTHAFAGDPNYFYIYGAYAKVNKDIHAAVYYPKGFVPDFPATQLDSVRVGTCRTFTDLNIARFRSIGVPVAKDFVPQWGSRSMSHEWVVLLPNEELCYPFVPMKL